MFLLWRERVSYTAAASFGAFVLLTLSLFVNVLAEPALATMGAYLIFGVAHWGRSGILSRVNNKNDISYGVYLYAWPIGNLLLWHGLGNHLWLVVFATLIIASACGSLSWHWLEKPIMRLVSRRQTQQHQAR